MDEKDDTALTSFEGETECIGDFFDVQFEYFMGEKSYAEAMASADCVQNSFEFLIKAIGGDSNRQTASRDEVRNFLNQVFFQDDPLNKAIIKYALHLKAWFIGGDDASVTSEEVHRLIGVLESYKDLLIKVKPLLTTMSWSKGEGNLDEFERAFAEARVHLGEFLDQLPAFIDPFDIEVLRSFILELDKYNKEDSGMVEYVDLFHGIVLLINGQDERVDIKKTTLAFYEFLHQYRLLNYELEVTLEDFVNNPEAYLEWLEGALTAVNQVVGEDNPMPAEGYQLIFRFISRQIL